ncbi:hypothetical protein [Bacillus sp. FJAT-44742]|uniref:hypothetical protein n=1 Tax=Bacillus sp. FJAT-44742 TaxID=2014005 RepID=UPI0012FEEA18|nr:hypothetical protein [Bacillus sp. FJAT-44742]
MSKSIIEVPGMQLALFCDGKTKQGVKARSFINVKCPEGNVQCKAGNVIQVV